MVFGLGRKKDEAAAQTQAPQMSPAAMEMLQQAATGAPAAGQAMAPSMTPGMEQAPPTGPVNGTIYVNGTAGSSRSIPASRRG